MLSLSLSHIQSIEREEGLGWSNKTAEMLQVPDQLRDPRDHVAAPDHEAHDVVLRVRGVRKEVHLRGRPQSPQEAEGVRGEVSNKLNIKAGSIGFYTEI